MSDSPSDPRRRRIITLAAMGMAATVCGVSAAEKPAPKSKKYSKERVGYRDEPYNGRTCGMCMLYAGEGECAIVEGVVRKEGWCTQWTPATMGAAPAAIG
jgi:hypothetical protein